MKRFSNSIRMAVESENWYGALVTALIMPDVCGRLETPDINSSQRYARWFNEWMGPNYGSAVGASGREHTFLSGEDCYALRCSLLHQGGANIERQKARIALDNFHFITPVKAWMVHCNQVDNMLQLQVDIFCLQMADAVDSWSASVAENDEITQNMSQLLIIHDSRNGIAF